MPVSLKEDAEVITSDGKRIGKVKRVVESDNYFIVYNKGLLTEEEIRVPISAILPTKDGSVNNEPIKLSMREETLTHGREFVQGEPNSEFMHGIKESEPKFLLEKQLVHFQPVEPAEEANKTGISSPPVAQQHQAVMKPGQENTTRALYSCDMCPAKFEKSEQLQNHRGESHKAPVNV
jgi:hypothetical protein